MPPRKRTLQRAFVVTVTAAVVATAAMACSEDGDDEPALDDPIEPTCTKEDCSDLCPVDEPSEGSPCSLPAEAWCDYRCDPPLGSGILARCVEGRWRLSTLWCNPPPCPSTAPELGSPCEDPAQGSCNYPVDTPCGEETTKMVCGEDETWTEETASTSCDVPPEQCQLYGSKGHCNADEGCQWLVPGCPDGPSDVMAGCYPVDDCTVTGCGDCGECTNVVPCHDRTCTTCNTPIDVCVGIDRAGP